MLKCIKIIFIYFLKIIFEISTSNQNDPKYIYIKYFLRKKIKIFRNADWPTFSNVILIIMPTHLEIIVYIIIKLDSHIRQLEWKIKSHKMDFKIKPSRVIFVKKYIYFIYLLKVG